MLPVAVLLARHHAELGDFGRLDAVIQATCEAVSLSHHLLLSLRCSSLVVRELGRAGLLVHVIFIKHLVFRAYGTHRVALVLRADG